MKSTYTSNRLFRDNSRRVFIAIFITVLFSHSTSAAAQKLYKWVDENGHVSYHDKPASENNTNSTQVKPTLQAGPSTKSNASLQQTDPIVVYTVPNCVACSQVLTHFKNMGISVNEQSINDRTVQQRIFEASGSLSVPTVFIGNRLIETIDANGLRSAVESVGYIVQTEQERQSTSPQQNNSTTENDISSEASN